MLIRGCTSSSSSILTAADFTWGFRLHSRRYKLECDFHPYLSTRLVELKSVSSHPFGNQRIIRFFFGFVLGFVPYVLGKNMVFWEKRKDSKVKRG